MTYFHGLIVVQPVLYAETRRPPAPPHCYTMTAAICIYPAFGSSAAAADRTQSNQPPRSLSLSLPPHHSCHRREVGRSFFYIRYFVCCYTYDCMKNVAMLRQFFFFVDSYLYLRIYIVGNSKKADDSYSGSAVFIRMHRRR